MNNGKHGQGTCAWTKMGADKPAEENTPYAPKLICPNCLPKPKSLGFRFHRAEFCLIFLSFLGQWNFKKKWFWDLLTYSCLDFIFWTFEFSWFVMLCNSKNQLINLKIYFKSMDLYQNAMQYRDKNKSL